MFFKLLPFELNLQFRQLGFWITVSILFLATFALMSLSIDSGSARIKVNGALAIAGQTAGFSALAIFFGAIYVVSGVMRDTVSKSLEIIHATPVPSSALILSRFTGAYLATFVSLLAMVLGVFAAQFAPWVDAEALGPINLVYFLQPTLIFVAINALLVTAIFCTIAMVTRSRTLVYVSSVALFVLYTISTSFISDDRPELLVALLDPFGTTSIGLETAFWAPEESNTQLIPLAGYILINRLVWGGIALGLFVICFLRFERGMGRFRKTKRGASADVSDTQEQVELYQLTKPLSTGGLRTLLTRIRFEYLSTVRSVAFMILAGLLIFFVIVTILVRNLITPDPSLPTNTLMANLVFAGSLLPLLFISIFFSGEIVWRDRVAKFTELLDSTRAANWTIMAGKWLTMVAIIFTIITGGALLGMTSQLALGDVGINLGTHFTNAYLNFAPTIILYCTLIMFIQNFMPNRVVGMIVGGLFVGAILFGIPQLPFANPLINYGSVPTGGFSEMNGFGDMTSYTWYLTYWMGLTGLFATASIWLWRRGVQTSLLNRLKSVKSQFTLGTSLLGAVSALAFFGAGASIYNGLEENNFRTAEERTQLFAKLEKELGPELLKPLPKIRDVELDVQFFPSTRSVNTTGHYIFENTTGAPLTQLYVSGTIGNPENVAQLDIQGASWSHETELEKAHASEGIRLYKFSPALAPGASARIDFDITLPTPTLGGNQTIRNNGTFVNNLQIAPRLGIIDFRLRNPDQRRRQDLPEFEEAADRTDVEARKANFFSPDADYVNFKATVCTDAGQIPIAPGRAVKIYEQDGRPCRDYVPNEPIAFFFAFVSADFETAEDTWTSPDGEKVDLAIYYDRQHDYNIALMLEAMKDSLDVFTETFGPYQYETLRIMEFPYGNFAQSFAGTIPFSENIGFVIDPGNPEDNSTIDLATYVTMHEIGHQWFGHQIVPANVKGFNVLSEGLTENAAMTAYENTYGWQKARRVLEQRTVRAYLTGRTLDSSNEPPLATAGGTQQYIIYSKASWVFWGLKQYIGEDNMQGAIRAFLNEYGGTGSPYPTTLELIEYLRAAAGPDYQQLITDYFNRLTFWDMKFVIDGEDNISVTENEDGSFKATFTIDLDKRTASEKTGREVSILEAEYEKAGDDETKGELIREAEALNEWIEIGFYDKDPDETFGDEWIKLERVHISAAKTTFSFDMETRPTHILLDPRRLLIERNVDDNKVILATSDDS